MAAKQVIAAPAKSLERIGPRQPVEVAHAAPPVGEVEVVPRPLFSQRFKSRGGCQLPRSTVCAAASRWGAGLEAGEGEPPSLCAAPWGSPWAVPLAGENEPRRR